jgi:hypothetical protein
MTSVQTLGQLLRMSAGQGTQIDVMRQLCGMVTGEFVSTCASGRSNLMDFNRQLNVWFMSLGRTLSEYMRGLNTGGMDTGTGYFWNDKTFPFYGSGSMSWSAGSVSGSGTSVKGWQWSNDIDSGTMLDDGNMSSTGSTVRGSRGQQGAWDACADREGAGKSRCIRQYLEKQNMQDSGARS